MGDHRMSIKIQAEFHDVKRTMDSWINYQGFDGVDSRVIEFFENLWNEGMAKYNDAIWKSQEQQRKVEAEEKDRKEFERLSAKYREKQ